MAFLGRFSQGEWLPIPLVTIDSNDDETTPDAAPTWRIYPNNSDVPVGGPSSFPPYAKDRLTGWFLGEVQLDDAFPEGHYRLLLQWVISGSTYAKEHRFEVVGGGDYRGAIISMSFAKYPHADFIVTQTDSGLVEARRSPRT